MTTASLDVSVSLTSYSRLIYIMNYIFIRRKSSLGQDLIFASLEIKILLQSKYKRKNNPSGH